MSKARSKEPIVTSTAASHGIPKLECNKCGHRWWPRKPEMPIKCPNGNCKNPFMWNR